MIENLSYLASLSSRYFIEIKQPRLETTTLIRSAFFVKYSASMLSSRLFYY